MSRSRRKSRSRRRLIIALCLFALVAILLGVAGFIIWQSNASQSPIAKTEDLQADEAPKAPEQATYDQPPADLSELLDRYAEAQGGSDKINQISSLRVEGYILEGDERIDFLQIKRMPDRSRISLEYDDFEITTYTNGQQAWRMVNDEPEAWRLNDQDAQQARRAGRILNPLWTERDTPGALKQLADEPLDGRMHHRVRVKQPGRPEEIFWIDPETYLETQHEFEDLAGRKVVTRFHEHEPVGWLMLPNRIEVIVDGEKHTEFIMEKAELNIGVFDSYFDVPEMAGDWPPPTRRKPN